MYLIAIAWIYVVLMMAVAEATGTGTLIGAVFTVLLYGALPLGIVLYIGGTPARRAARRREAAAALAAVAEAPAGGSPGRVNETAAETSAPDGGGHAPGAAVTPERKEP